MRGVGEWYEDPAVANYRLELLGKQMEKITHAALGRGVAPLVSDELAKEVGEVQGEYLAWRQSLGGFELVTSWIRELAVWEKRANALAAKVAAEGQKVPPPLVGPGAGLPRLPGEGEAWNWEGIAGMVGAGMLLILAAMLIRK